VLNRDIRSKERGREPVLQPRAVLPRQDARFADIPARDTVPLAVRREISPKADLALGTVIILGTRYLFLPEADIRLPKPLRMVCDRGKVKGASSRELNRARGRILTALRREAVRVGGDVAYGMRRRGGLVPSACVDEGRQAHFLAFGKAVGVSRRIAGIEG